MDRLLFLEYLDKLTVFLENNHSKNLVSIILFGSLVNMKERMLKSTDVDLLVIIKDSCSLKDFKRIKGSIHAIERRYLSNLGAQESLFLKGLQNATGMFCNFFLCHFSDFKNRHFIRVFSVNPIMGALLAPQNSVWLSLLMQHRILWGQNVFKEWETLPNLTKGDLLRSFLINWLLATGALFIYPYYTHVAKFSMESLKWSLFTWKNVLHPKKTLSQTITTYITHASIVERQALRCFIEFRKKKKTCRYFCFLAWIFVLQIHYSLFRSSYG